MNEWQKLVSLVESDKLKRKEVVIALGYKDISKGTNKFMTQIRNKTINEQSLEIASKILQFDYNEVNLDYFSNKKTIRREKDLLNKISNLEEQIKLRDDFKPYVYIETSRKRPPIIIGAAIFENIRYLKNLPVNIICYPVPEQIKIVREIILEHYDKNDGKCPFFDNITGYTYYWRFNDPVKFSILGVVLN